MQLDLNLLTALDALLEEESVTGAADRLHLSAPAMSRTLGRIRQATGDQILIRTGRNMKPTPRALALREEVRSLVLRTAEVLAPERDLHLETLQRTFALQAHDALSTALAPVLVKRVADVAPGVSLRFLGEPADETPNLRRGLIDLAIGSGFQKSPEMELDSVGTDELVGLARRGHPLLDKAEPGSRIDLGAWVSVSHVVVSRRGRLRDLVDDQIDKAGHSRRVIASTASTGAALEIVRSTEAVVVIPTSVARRLETDFVTFTLPIVIPAVPIVLAWHRRFGTDKGHQWLRSLVREELAQSSVSNGSSR